MRKGLKADPPFMALICARRGVYCMWSLADPLKIITIVASDADRGGHSAFMEFHEVKYSPSVGGRWGDG